MFTNFFLELKSAKVPVSLREYLTLLEAMKEDLADRQGRLSGTFSRRADHMFRDETLTAQPGTNTRGIFPTPLGQRPFEVRGCSRIPGRLGMAQDKELARHRSDPSSSVAR